MGGKILPPDSLRSMRQLSYRKVEVLVRIRLIDQVKMPPFFFVGVETALCHSLTQNDAVLVLSCRQPLRSYMRTGSHKVEYGTHVKFLMRFQVDYRQINGASLWCPDLSAMYPS